MKDNIIELSHIRQIIYLILSKCGIIVRLCGAKRTDEALAGVGDFTVAVTDLLKYVAGSGNAELSSLFNSAHFLQSLQIIVAAMMERNEAVISEAFRTRMIPFLETAYGKTSENSCENICKEDTEENNDFDESTLNSAASDTRRSFENISKAARDREDPSLRQLWNREEAQNWFSSIDYDGKDHTICVFGNGDGVCISFLKESISSGSSVIVFEPENGNIIDFRDELQQRVDFYRQEGLIVCAHPLYREVFASEYAAFLHAINENRTRVMVNKNTLARFKEDAPRNVIRNLPMLAKTNLISELKKILPSDVPVIIVAAGPSLDKNIDLLKRAKGHCLIFAVDTAMKYLLSHDIIPDLGITIEPIKPMANYEDDRCFDIPHVFDSESNPEIVSRQRARTFIYNCRDYVKRLLTALGKNVPPDVASGGSVATAAFAICYQLQMKRIIMIGQDLAYQGEATHAGGVESKGINNNIGYEMVDGIDGGKVRTRSDWLAYLKWFENAIALMKDSGYDMEVIDATEGGALIHGSKVMTLAEAIDEYCVLEYDFAGALEKLPYILNSKEYEALMKQVEKSAIELDMVENTAREAARLCEYELTRIRENSIDNARTNDACSDVSEKNGYVKQTGNSAVQTQLTQARITCEKALLYPLINNYAVTGIVEEVSRLRLEMTGQESELLQQKLAFEAIVDACGYFRRVMGERTEG